MNPHRPFPVATLGLALATLAGFGLELAGGGMKVCETFGLVPSRLLAGGSLLPLVSHLALHDPSHWSHIALNVVVLLLVAPPVERAIGGGRMLAVYVLGGVLGGLTHAMCTPGAVEPLVGGSAAVFSVLAVAATIRPKAWLAFAVSIMAFTLCQLLTASGGSVSVAAHTGGFIAGAVFAVVAAARGTIETWRRAAA